MNQPAQALGGVPCLDFVNRAGDFHTDTEPHLERFRSMLWRLLGAEARGVGGDATDLAQLNRILVRAGARRGLVSTVRGYGWGWLDEAAGIERLLWPIAFSAARLLEGPDLSRLRSCGGCGRLFLDGSRNRSRRWCDMQGCGNREKQRRRRQRIG